MKGTFVRVLVFGMLLSGWPVVGLAQKGGDYEVEPKVVRVPISEVVGRLKNRNAPPKMQEGEVVLLRQCIRPIMTGWLRRM